MIRDAGWYIFGFASCLIVEAALVTWGAARYAKRNNQDRA